MKISSLSILLSLIVCALGGEIIPVREPKIGESRPSWWLSLWMDHVVVIEGTLEWNDDREPEIQIKSDREALSTVLDKKDIELVESTSKFYLGRVKPKRLLFASPGITSENLTIDTIARGQLREMPFLLPVMEIQGMPNLFTTRKGRTGVFIFHYGSMMMTHIRLIFDESIPDDGMASAEALFAHRKDFDHRNPNKQAEEQDGGGNAIEPLPRPSTAPTKARATP